MVSLDNEFTLIQWNSLGIDSCDSASFPMITPELLSWDYRKLLYKSIFEQNKVDLICLEEVDKLNEYEKIFSTIGDNYNSIYYKKVGSNPQGIAVFYNKEKFKLVKEYKFNFKDENGNDQSQFCLINFFTLFDNITICLIVTHLKAKHEFEKTRLKQIKQICDHLSSQEFLIIYSEELNCKGLIICGDFNAEPTNESINYLKNFKFIQTKLSNAFEDADFTTFKIREEEYIRVIDYIFYYNLGLIKTNKLMTKTEIGPNGLPNESFPSDHLYLKANFKFF